MNEYLIKERISDVFDKKRKVDRALSIGGIGLGILINVGSLFYFSNYVGSQTDPDVKSYISAESSLRSIDNSLEDNQIPTVRYRADDLSQYLQLPAESSERDQSYREAMSIIEHDMADMRKDSEVREYIQKREEFSLFPVLGTLLLALSIYHGLNSKSEDKRFKKELMDELKIK